MEMGVCYVYMIPVYDNDGLNAYFSTINFGFARRYICGNGSLREKALYPLHMLHHSEGSAVAPP
jgi:hypothetical protein